MVAALQQGRRDALGQLYDSCAPIMMGIITRIVQDKEVAEEVLKETFVAIWSRIGVYDSSKNRLLTWSLAIARGIALEAVKSDRYQVVIQEKNNLKVSGTEDIEKRVLGDDRQKLHTFDHVDSIGEMALNLLYIKGRSCAETAVELRLSEQELKAVLRKAFIHLKAGKAA